MALFRRPKTSAVPLPSTIPFPEGLEAGYDKGVAHLEARIARDRAVAAEGQLAGVDGGDRVCAALAEALPAVYVLAEQQKEIDQLLARASAGALTRTLQLELDRQYNHMGDLGTYQIHDWQTVLDDQHAAVAWAQTRESPEREWFLDLLVLRGAMMTALHDAVGQTVRIADKALWLVSVTQAGAIDAALADVDTSLAFQKIDAAEGNVLATASAWSGRDPEALTDPSQSELLDRWHQIYDDSVMAGHDYDVARELADRPPDLRPHGLVEKAQARPQMLEITEAAESLTLSDSDGPAESVELPGF